MTRYAAAIIALLSTPATASTLPYPNPVLTEYGLVLSIDQRGHPAYRPLDGVDQWLAGKAGHLLPDQGPSWVSAFERPRSHHTARTEPPALRLPPGLVSNPACERPPYPWFCEMDEPPVDPPEPPAVPLPGSAWMLLAGLLSLFYIPRRKIARRRDDLVAKPGA